MKTSYSNVSYAANSSVWVVREASVSQNPRTISELFQEDLCGCTNWPVLWRVCVWEVLCSVLSPQVNGEQHMGIREKGSRLYNLTPATSWQPTLCFQTSISPSGEMGTISMFTLWVVVGIEEDNVALRLDKLLRMLHIFITENIIMINVSILG